MANVENYCLDLQSCGRVCAVKCCSDVDVIMLGLSRLLVASDLHFATVLLSPGLAPSHVMS